MRGLQLGHAALAAAQQRAQQTGEHQPAGQHRQHQHIGLPGPAGPARAGQQLPLPAAELQRLHRVRPAAHAGQQRLRLFAAVGTHQPAVVEPHQHRRLLERVEQQHLGAVDAGLRLHMLQHPAQVQRGRDQAAGALGPMALGQGPGPVHHRGVEHAGAGLAGGAAQRGEGRRGDDPTAGPRLMQRRRPDRIDALVDALQRLQARGRHGVGHREMLGAARRRSHQPVGIELADRLAVQPVAVFLEGVALRLRHPRQPGEEPDPRALAQDGLAGDLQLVPAEIDAVVQVAQPLQVALGHLQMILQRDRQHPGVAGEVGQAGAVLQMAGHERGHQGQSQPEPLQRQRLRRQPPGSAPATGRGSIGQLGQDRAGRRRHRKI